MKKLKIGINGFGRIGRAIYRINDQKDFFDVVVINDINPDIKNIAYLLQYDTTYGRLGKKVEHDKDALIVGSKRAHVYHESRILDVPWEKYDVDVVIDSSGIMANFLAIKNCKSKVKNFVVTNAQSNGIKTIIFGVNEHELKPDIHKVISSSICDTIALSPLIKLISETHQIESGYLITLHPWLSYQNLLDGPSISWSQPGDIFSHYALGRSSVQNIISKSTSAILAADHVFPALSKKIESVSYRVPTSIVSGAALTLILDKDIDRSELIDRFSNFEKKQKIKIICNTTEPLTSADYLGEEYSVIVDHRWTKVKNKRHVRLMYWYDNEWGYSCRVVDLVNKLSDYYNIK